MLASVAGAWKLRASYSEARHSTPGSRSPGAAITPSGTLTDLICLPCWRDIADQLVEAAAITSGVPPRYPMAVGKAPTSVAGPADDVQPAGARTVDYEVELGVIITAASRVPPETGACGRGRPHRR